MRAWAGWSAVVCGVIAWGVACGDAEAPPQHALGSAGEGGADVHPPSGRGGASTSAGGAGADGGAGSGPAGAAGARPAGDGGSALGGASPAAAGAGGADDGAGGTSGAGGVLAGGAGGQGGDPGGLSCDGPAPTLEPSCGPQQDPDGGNECRECMKAECCQVWQTCYGTQPRGVCGYGAALGDAIGEMDCVLLCWYTSRDDSQSREEILATCAERCGTCAGDTTSEATSDLVACAYSKCADTCFPLP